MPVTEEKDVLRVEGADLSATIAAIINRQIGFSRTAPYPMVHKWNTDVAGESEETYSSDRGDREQDGNVALTVGKRFVANEVRVLSSGGTLKVTSAAGLTLAEIYDSGALTRLSYAAGAGAVSLGDDNNNVYIDYGQLVAGACLFRVRYAAAVATFELQVEQASGSNYSVFKVLATGVAQFLQPLTFSGSGRVQPTKTTADSVTLSTGTSGSTVSDLQTAHDGNVYAVTEAAATPGIDLVVDFVGVTAFSFIQIIAYYAGSTSHTVSVELYNWSAAAWQVFDSLRDSGGDTMECHDFTVPSDTPYIGTGGDAGRVRVRFDHTLGGSPSHNLNLDVVAVYQ